MAAPKTAKAPSTAKRPAPRSGQLSLSLVHHLENGRITVWVDEQQVFRGPIRGRITQNLLLFKFRTGTVRKVLPLQSKLADLDCWITGLRRQQSDIRAGIGTVELYAFDEANGHDIVKLNPLANWSREAVWEYIKEHKIPYNPLHDQGYRSIGCWPCTRKTRNGESERAGRWTGFNKVECGIHTFLPKKVDFQI